MIRLTSFFRLFLRLRRRLLLMDFKLLLERLLFLTNWWGVVLGGCVDMLLRLHLQGFMISWLWCFGLPHLVGMLGDVGLIALKVWSGDDIDRL